jgi:glycosyltransferase involved in cell wall biosynthesis
MTTPPLVSVIVPTFNRVRFLGEALRSAIAQTYRTIEIIVSDDGSTENVFETVVAPLGDPRIVYRRNAKTLGMGLNIWGALTSASGKYVATLHDDDLWEPDFLSRLVPPLERDPSIAVAFCDHAIIDEAGVLNPTLADANMRTWHRDILAAGRIDRFMEIALVNQSVPAAMAALFRKDAVDWTDFPPEIGTHYDVWLTYLSARTGAAGYYDPARLTRYRVHQASETVAWGRLSGRLRALRQAEFMLRRCLGDPTLASIRPVIEARYRHTVNSFTIALLEDGKPREAREMLRRATSLVRFREHGLMLAATALPRGLLKGASRISRRARLFLSSLVSESGRAPAPRSERQGPASGEGAA